MALQDAHIDTDRLGLLVVRDAVVPKVDRDGGQVYEDDPDTGERRPVHQGSVMAPGFKATPFADGKLGMARLKLVGDAPDGIGYGSVVRLREGARVGAWGRRSDTRAGIGSDTDLTITAAAGVDVVADPDPDDLAAEGVLPVKFPFDDGDDLLLLSVQPRPTRDGTLYLCTLMVPPSRFHRTGEVVVTVPVQPAARPTQRVRAHDLAVTWTKPEKEDANRGRNVELTFAASRLETVQPAMAGNGRSRRSGYEAPAVPAETADSSES